MFSLVESYFSILDRVTMNTTSIASRSSIVTAKMNKVWHFYQALGNSKRSEIIMLAYSNSLKVTMIRKKHELELTQKLKDNENKKAKLVS
jgi:hypothetical protein